jgi:hypothetical protein
MKKPRYLPGPYAARQLTLIDQSGDELDRAQFAHERAHRPRGDQSERAGASRCFQPCQMMRVMLNFTLGLPRCLGLWAETKRRSEKPWPKSERPNGEHGTKVLRLAKETASRRIR